LWGTGLGRPCFVNNNATGATKQELVIGGYRTGGHGIDALLVGYYDRKQLRFAGKVRAGFTPHLRRLLWHVSRACAAPAGPSGTDPASGISGPGTQP
jgi:hypothetical protein